MKKLTIDGYTYKITAEEERIFKEAAKVSLEEEKPKTAKVALEKKKPKKKKKKIVTKDPLLRWLCYWCAHVSKKSTGHLITAITLKCSLCDEHLIVDDGRSPSTACCPNCTNEIARPVCYRCGKTMAPYGDTLAGLKGNTELYDDTSDVSRKEPWWEKVEKYFK